MHMGMSVRRRGVRECCLNRQVFGRVSARKSQSWEMMIRALPWKGFKTPMIRCRPDPAQARRAAGLPAPSQDRQPAKPVSSRPRQAVRQPVFEPASPSCSSGRSTIPASS